MSARRRRGLLAATALLSAAALTWGAVSGAPQNAAAEPGAASTATASPTQLPSPATAAPVEATTPPSEQAPAPAPWQPSEPVGLTEPVEEVLADAPATGPVRIVTLSEDAAGKPEITVTEAPDRARAADAVEAARDVAGALAVTVDHKVSAASVGKPTPVTAANAPRRAAAAAAPAMSNDEYRYLQWSLDTLQAETAWQTQTGTGQTVAVIDTGVDAGHPDLAGRLVPGIDMVAGDGTDGNKDPHGHGTHVAGTIAAVANNALGVTGLAPGAKIMPVRVLAENGSGWSSDIADGIIWAADHGATVLNMSLGGSGYDAAEASAVRYAQSKNVVVVAAAGNHRQEGSPTSYPAAFPGVVAVAATDVDNTGAVFSNIGSYVTLAAPGVDIVSTYPWEWGGYAYMSGTSMASPHTAATVALMRAAAPKMAATDIIAKLVATTDDLGAPGRDDEFGAGLIDPVAALQTLQAPAAPGAPGSLTAKAGNAAATVSWSAAAANGSPITKYTVTSAPGNRTCTTTGALSCTVSGLTNGTAYTFTVTATNAVGTGPASAPSAAVTPAAAPGAPGTPTAKAGNGSATVTWSAAAANGSPITKYTVTAKPGGATVTTTGATTATVSGLTNGTAYTFTVTATNAVGTGPASAPSAAITPIASATVPGAPGTPTAKAGNGSATVTWSAAAANGSPITKYTVTAAPGGRTCTTTGATTCTVTGLTNGTAYTVTVTATNAVGTGPTSARSAAVTPVAPTVDRLTAGQQLTAGQRLTSPNGQYTLEVQADGNVVVYAPGKRPLWSSRTWGNPGARLALQNDGNLVVYAANGRAVWNSDTWGNPGGRLVLQNDGNVVLYNGAGTAVWFTGWDRGPGAANDTLLPRQQLTSGQQLTSPNRQYSLVVQPDGNVVLYAPGNRAAWSSRTWGKPGTRLVLQADGNLVASAPGRQTAWHTGTGGNPNDRLVMQNDGNLVLYASTGRALWSSKYGRAS